MCTSFINGSFLTAGFIVRRLIFTAFSFGSVLTCA